jgi:hypothetical protein
VLNEHIGCAFQKPNNPRHVVMIIERPLLPADVPLRTVCNRTPARSIKYHYTGDLPVSSAEATRIDGPANAGNLVKRGSQFSSIAIDIRYVVRQLRSNL